MQGNTLGLSPPKFEPNMLTALHQADGAPVEQVVRVQCPGVRHEDIEARAAKAWYIIQLQYALVALR